MPTRQISLYYKDGSSDKVYHAQIEQQDSGYVVNFQYGRRGGNLATGTKTKTPIALDKANSVFDSLVKEKTSKGYTEGESGAVFQSKSLVERITGIVPQLLNKIKEEDLDQYLKDDSFIMQEKMDGKRIIVKAENGKITAINKKGLETLIPQSVCDMVLSFKTDCTLDGELIAEKYHVFDLLSWNGQDMRQLPYNKRYNQLKALKINNVVPLYFTYEDKKKALEELRMAHKEGVVFKKNTSQYVSGRPASGGNQLKYKFYETGTFEVHGHHPTKNSVFICAYDEKGNMIELGKVTISANFDKPDIGSFVEVRYLYCHIGGALYQSNYLGVRDDQDRTDCTVSQIKYKAPNEDEDDEE